MWLLLPEGLYSIVQKSGQAELCVRARDASDLDRLRESLVSVAHSLTYPNFKSEVSKRDPERAHVYATVWRTLGEIQPGGPYSR